MRTVIQRQGYQVLEAAHGIEALNIASQHTGPIHLLLTDMVMPGGMTGRELAGQLRKHRPGIPAIFTSGYSVDTAGENLSLQANDAFIQKPVTPQELLATIQKCLTG